MRTLVISVLVFLTAIFCLIPISAQTAEENQSEEQQTTEHAGTAIASTVAESNDVSTDTEETMNAAGDPNVINARIEEFEGLKEALQQLDTDGKEASRMWTRRNEERLELLLATQQQAKLELQFLRELAAEEGAEKTTAAIDKILLDRQDRFKPVIERFEKEKERLRREEEREEEREQRDRERGRDRRRSR